MTEGCGADAGACRPDPGTAAAPGGALPDGPPAASTATATARRALPEGWRRMALGECAQFRSGNTPSKERAEYWGGLFPWVTAKDMKRFMLEQSELGLTHKGREVAALAPPGAVLVLTRGMTLLKDLPVCLTACEMAFNQDVKALVPADGIDARFLALQLIVHKPDILGLVDTAGHGTGRLDTERLKRFQVAIAPLAEQRAIGTAIQAWDGAIDAAEQLVLNSRRQRQAMMQVLLTGKKRLRLDRG